MGRPLKKTNFGANANNNLKVQFNNGTMSVPGYILKQYSSRKFKCKDYDGNIAICKIVDKHANDLLAGEMSITLKSDTGITHQAVRIHQNLATVVYSGTNYVTGGTHNSDVVYGQVKWSYSPSTTDTYWQVEEAGTDTTYVAEMDSEGDETLYVRTIGNVTSINEGSNLTFSVTGTNLVNGNYYWTVSRPADFTTATTYGTFAIASNTGTFVVQPWADLLNEGAETFTVSVKHTSTAGFVLGISDSITINDTSYDPDLDYPVPGSGTYLSTATAFTAMSYAHVGTTATVTGGISTVTNSATGLLRTKYAGNWEASPGDSTSTWNTNFYNTSTLVKSIAESNVSWGSQVDTVSQQNFSCEWKGYVKVPTTQNYNWYIHVDDDAVMWIGDEAVTGNLPENAVMYGSNESMPGSAITNANSLAMDSTKWYPIRLWMTEFNGASKFQIFAIGEDGSTFNATGLSLSYNTATGGYNP